jgi:hypothetical protein
LELSQINETRKTLQESAGTHELNSKRPTGNFGSNNQRSKRSNRFSKGSSQKIHSIENLIEQGKLDVIPRKSKDRFGTDANLNKFKSGKLGKYEAERHKKHAGTRVKFGDTKEINSAPRKEYRRRDRRGTKTEEKLGKEKRIVAQLPGDRSKSKKKKGFMSNFMEMLGFGCCGTR